VVVPLVAALVAALWARRDRAWLGALLWLAFATGNLDGLSGAGLVPGLWAHPLGALGLVATAAAVLALARVAERRWAWAVLAAAVAAGWLAAAAFWSALGEGVTPLGPLSRLLLVSLQQGLWLPLGAYGLVRRGEPASRALVAAGAALLLVPWPGVALEPWGPHAVYRLGLMLAAVAPLAEVCGLVGAALAARLPALRPRSALALGAALLLAGPGPGSFLVWWHPVQLDALYADSLDPVPSAIVQVAAAVRSHTGPQAVIVAAPEYAGAVTALAGRRVVRAPGFGRLDDSDDRWRAEQRVIEGRPGDRLVRRYGVSHVLLAPGDFVDRGLLRPEDLAARGPFTLVYQDAAGFRLYAVTPAPQL